MLWHGNLQPYHWILVIIWISTPADSASFYGASHLKVPLEDARSTTDLYFRFQTHKPNALLFLAAGSIDYCLLLLEGGEIKVRINLGAGEALLNSSPGLRLDDSLWHHIEVHRTDGELTLIIDNLHTSELDIPGRFFELNVKYGIFIGGLGSFSELFLGNIPNFRGCIDDVIFNDYDILKMALDITDQRNVYLVTWDCSEEFEVASQQPVSFMERGSYIAYPGWSSRNGGSVEFDIKTQTQTAVLFYNAGVSSKTDFITMELLFGKVAMSVNEGNGVVVLQSDVIVNDGTWHHVEVQFSPSYMELDVDGHMKNLRPGLGDNRYFDLAGFFYVGGVELSKQSRALQNGLQSILSEGAESSLKGCMKNLKVNNELYGLREAEVTHGIQPDCLWDYPCLQDPCITGAECFQDGVDGFRCMCDAESCVRSNFTSGYKLYTKASLPIDLEILSLRPLEVTEGGSDLISSDHIKVILDFQKYGVRKSGVLFHIIESPKYGTLEVEIWRRIADNIFTLPDLETNKVRYSHDGSESLSDTVVLELEFRARNFRLPPFLEERHRFVFHIQVLPVNDPPKLKLPPGKILRMAKYTKRLITKDILEALDPDNTPGELLYKVLSASEGDSDGFVEHSKSPGVSTTSFTQEDIDNGFISYVNRGSSSSRLSFRVTDGTDSGQTGAISIVAFDLVISLVNNTGIVLPYDSYALITAENLTFTHNSPDQDLEIKYEITKLPQYGHIQRLRNNNQWYTVTRFTQRQLKKEKLRYIHTSGRPTYDEFNFAIHCMDVKISTTYDVRVAFIAINLRQVNAKDLLLEKNLEAHITESELKFETYPIQTQDDQIKFTLINPPQYGNLLHFAITGSEHRHNKLETSSVFTQNDIAQKAIKYKLHRKSYSVINDNFTYKVECPGGVVLDELQFRIQHTPGDNDAIIINEKITVLEGGEATIGSSELHLEIPGVKNIFFNVTVQPKHGTLKKTVADIIDTPVTYFTSDDLVNNRLAYVHDDSENERDRFNFIASDSNGGADSFVFYGTVHIHVIMKNDNPPFRLIDRLYHVVLDGERKLTGEDLKYVDADIDSKPSDIVYSPKGFTNGKIYSVSDLSTEITEFNQVDLDEGKIIFRQNGPAYGKAILRITDGKFYVTGVLEIQASKPYIHISCNTGLVVKRGENGLLTAGNLTVETNLNADPADITYKVTSPPKYGEILLNGKPITQFSQKDLISENIEYENDNSVSFRDYLGFSAFLGDNNVDGIVEFRIYPEVYWDPLRIINNKSLYIDEDKLGKIDSSHLNIAQISISPVNISYQVKETPRHGFLAFGTTRNVSSKKSKEADVLKFTQRTIDDGLLHYIPTEKNVSDDSFTFDVSNGITALKGLTYKLNIISKIIFLKTSNLTVIEGHGKTLKTDDIGVTNPYYTEWIMEYLIIEQPRHGYIANSRVRGSKLQSFSALQLNSGHIRYEHDGSEANRDWFTLVAKAKALDKESSPSTIHVIIDPVNDETPHLIKNTGLDVWERDITTITNEQLAAADDDSDPEDIVFTISSPSNGYVAFKNDTKTPILSFTQQHINKNFVVFVHTGEKAGGFRIEISDGVNHDSPHVFTVTARVLRMIVATNEKLSILPRMQQSITKDHLYIATNDHDITRIIEFKVTKGPVFGRILKENPDGSLSSVNRFTQEHVNKNLLLYEHIKPMTGLTALDEISFDIETLHAETIKDLKFEVEISVGNIGGSTVDSIISLHPVEVQEGSSVSISQEHIDLSQLISLWQGKVKSEYAKKIRIVVQKLPNHGWLEFEGVKFTTEKNMSFGRDELRKKKIKYYHDDSETLNDSFILGFYISDGKGNPDVLLFNGSMNVSVQPVNDNIFKILTKTTVLEVVQGQSVIISPKTLNVSDPDGFPEDIVYETMISPQTGKLVLTTDTNVPIRNFTQADINRYIVQYIHDGSKENRTGFHFKVSDGKHKPDYAVLNILVVPVTLELINNSVIEVKQGSTAVFLTRSHLGATTNANNEEEIEYNITSPPFHGHIFVKNDVALSFHQEDIDRGHVFYMQSDLTVSEDYFVFTVFMFDSLVEEQLANITVAPLIDQKPLVAVASSPLWITLEFLNATKLAQQTRSNPVYTVTKGPEYGVLRKLQKQKRSTREKSSFMFTHEDIIQRRILYEFKDLHITHEVTDRFDYLLTAQEVQPAIGSFSFVLHPSPRDNTTSDLIITDMVPEKPPSPPPRHDQRSTLPPPQISEAGNFQPSIIGNDYILIIAVVFGVILVSTITIIFIKCRAVRNQRNKDRFHHCSSSYSSKDRRIHGSHTTQSDLDASDNNPSNGSASVSDDLPPPAPPTSPSSTSSRTGCINISTPKTRTLRNKPCLDADPPLPPPPYILENGEWTEVTVCVPTCKVTPISHDEQGEFNQTTLKSPYFLRERCDDEEWFNYEGSELRYGPPANPVLKKNQYWV